MRYAPLIGRLLLAALATLALASGPTAAQPAPSYQDLEEADIERLLQLIEAIREAEAEERWGDALSHYEEMWALLPLPEYRLPQAICHERLGSDVRALAIYLELIPSPRIEIAKLAAQRANPVAERLALLPARLRIVSEPPDARVLIDDELRGLTSARGVTIETTAGAHLVTVQREGFASVARDVLLGPGDELVLTLMLEPVTLARSNETGSGDSSTESLDPTPPPTDGADDGGTLAEHEDGGELGGNGVPPARREIAWPVGLGAAAGATAITGTVLGLLANARADDAWSAFAANEPASRVSHLNDQSEGFAAGSTVAFIAAGALAAGALVALLVGAEDVAEDRPPLSAVVAPAFTQDIGGAVLRLSFKPGARP